MQYTVRRCVPCPLLLARTGPISGPSSRAATITRKGRRKEWASLVGVGGALQECRRFASFIMTTPKGRCRPARAASSNPKEELKQKWKQQSRHERWLSSDTHTRKVAGEEGLGNSAMNAVEGGATAETPLEVVRDYKKTSVAFAQHDNSLRGASVGAEIKANPTESGGGPCGTQIGSLLDIEDALNLRLATLMRQPGKAFRAITVMFTTKREINFAITFEDIASGTTLRCRLEEVPLVYKSWVRQFRASWVVFFVPTLSTANMVLLENAILYGGLGGASRTNSTVVVPASSDKAEASFENAVEEPDHVFLSYSKLREILCKTKRDEQVNKGLLSNAVLNAYAEEWRTFIHAPNSCSPIAIVTAASDFRPSGGQLVLNKQLLHAQLTVAAMALQLSGKRSASSSRGSGNSVVRRKEPWMLVFVSAPLASASGKCNSAVPPMQDLLTGEFVEPLLLGEKYVIYIIGSGTAADSFAHFPLARKGKQRVSILLQDIESQLGLRRPSRLSLTATLIQALERFSRYTWMGLMQEETDALRVPRPAQSFLQLHRRTVTREILPSFLEAVFGQTSMNASPTTCSTAVVGGVDANTRTSRRLEEHVKAIFNSTERLEREKVLRAKLRACGCFFVDVKSANVTAARRADNPFSARNGIVEFQGQFWSSLDADVVRVPPRVQMHSAKLSANGDVKAFVDPGSCIPDGLPIGGEGMVEGGKRQQYQQERQHGSLVASSGIIIAWDVKRALLFLRESKKIRQFLHNGGRIWCAQYAQYLLRGFNHDNLATMERTLLQYHTGQGKLHSVEKLKIIFEKQLEIAVNTRQLISILHRMDGLLAATEMELRGLQIATQGDVTTFSHDLKTTHEKLEKVVNDKIMEFTVNMDDEVRRKINFRSPQDISTIIYGGTLCRHLGTRYMASQPVRTPVTALFPHAVCRVTATPIPAVYMDSEGLMGLKGLSSNNGEGGSNNRGRVTSSLSMKAIEGALATIEKYTARNTLENLLHSTAVVVVTCKVRPGNFIEVFSMHCPCTEPNGEFKYNVTIDDVVPVTDEPEMLTLMQLKDKIASYKPLRALQPLKKYGKKSYDVRNLLILSVCSQDRLTALVDSGIVQTIAQTVLGNLSDDKAPLERVCFCDLQRALPPPPQGAGSFESDFLGLVDAAEHAGFSARGNWEALAREFVTVGGFEGAMKALVSHCASLMGTARDPFRSTHPLPLSMSVMDQRHGSLHGQERASTRGLLWMVTPEKLHPLLYRSLRGRNPSSGADAIERITVLLSADKQIDLSFFKALQQLRFTEKKMQLFEEGALFRAVLPECKDRVHGELCHTVTATGRLSSQSPNLQNIPKEEDLRRLIVSRFGTREGRMIEADYSQLEVVVLAALSRDARMLQELRGKVDFHCLRVSLMTKEPYEDVVRKAKQEKDPHYIQLRQQAKTFSFQRQYGAGIATIATTTGLTEQEVERLIAAEEQHYRDLSRYYRLVTDCVEAGADRLLRLRTLDAATWSPSMRRMILLTEPMHYFVVQTGSKFDLAKDKKSIPRLKNYPVQGLAGEIVQIMCGKIIRRFYSKNNYNNKAFLVNTVHDCVWIDAHASVADEVMSDVSDIMSSTSEVISSLWPEMKLDVPFSADIHIGPSLGELSK